MSNGTEALEQLQQEARQREDIQSLPMDDGYIDGFAISVVRSA